MKNLNAKAQYIKAKKKIYHGSAALIALMSVSSPVQAMEKDDEMPRVRCLWHLGTKGYRASALEILEQKVFNEPSRENSTLRIKYLKKLGEFLKDNPEFLKQNPEHAANLKGLQSGKEKEDSPLSKFYQETLEKIATTDASQEEKDFQILKLEAFYNRLENSKERSDEINARYNNLKNSFNIEKKLEDKLDVFKIFHIDEEIIIDDLKTKYEEAKQNSDERAAFFRRKVGKGYFKLARNAEMTSDLIKQGIENYLIIKSIRQGQELQFDDEVMRKFESNLVKSVTHQVSYFENSAKYNIQLANYFLGKTYSNKYHGNINFFDISAAYKYYQKIAKEEPLAAYDFSKILEIGVLHPNIQGNFLVHTNKPQAKIFREQAEKKGHPCAQYDLAKDFFEKNDEAKGFELLEKSAKGGHPAAQLDLARKYEKEKNSVQASSWYKKAAEQGEESAYYPAGYAYETESKPNYQQAIYFYKALTAKDARADVRLGKMYLKGKGTEKSEPLALGYFLKAADQGNADGNYYLGLMQLKGQGFPKPMHKEAFENFSRAADKNHSKALFRLGIMNQFALGTEQNYDEAKKSYEKSEIPAASYYLGGLYKQGLGVEVDAKKSLEQWKKAAESGHKKSAYKAGKTCFKLWKDQQDKETEDNARKYLEQAVADEAIGADALYSLGYMEQKKQNPSKAKAHYIKAAEAGHAIAQFELGKFYEGIGKPDKAAAYYRDAADQGHADAQLDLIDLYLEKEKKEEAITYSKEIYPEVRIKERRQKKKLIKIKPEEFKSWFEYNASQGNPYTQRDLGKFLEAGIVLEAKVCQFSEPLKEIKGAISLYQEAAKRGNRSAQRRLNDFKKIHLFEAFQIEESEISKRNFSTKKKSSREALLREDHTIEKSEIVASNAEEKKLPNRPGNSIQSKLLDERDNEEKKQKAIEEKNDFNSLKIINYINAAEKNIEDGNDKIAEHLDVLLQEELTVQDDYKLAVNIEKASSSPYTPINSTTALNERK